MIAAGSSRACRSARQPFLAQAFELGGRERRAQHDVGHERQRIGQVARPASTAHRRGVERCSCRARAEELDGVGELQRRSVARALVEHGRGHAGDAELPGRIVAGARLHEQVDLHERHLVLLDHPHGEPVRQRVLLDRRAASAPAGAPAWRLQRSAASAPRARSGATAQHQDDRQGLPSANRVMPEITVIASPPARSDSSTR